VNGVGQKLHKDWEIKHKQLKDRVARAQQPKKMGDNDGWLPGTQDEHFANTDHVPTWIEPVGNSSWVFPEEQQRHVATGGSEKSRFTTQLSITKAGAKLKPFCYLEGKATKIRTTI
jgi:hypothetical protein